MSNFFKALNTILGICGILIIIALLIKPINLILSSHYKYLETLVISPYLIFFYIIVNILGFFNIITVIFQPVPSSTKAFNWGITTLISMVMLVFCAYYIMKCSSFFSMDPELFTNQEIISFSKFVIYGSTGYGVLAIGTIFIFLQAPSYFLKKLDKQLQESNCISNQSLVGNNNQLYN